MTDPHADDAARLQEAVARAVHDDPVVHPATGPMAKASMVTVHKPEHLATQSVYPWRTAVRAGVATALAFLTAAAVAAPIIGPFVERYIPGAEGTVVGFGVFCGGLALLINRLANLPQVTSFLTRLGLGPIPKHH